MKRIHCYTTSLAGGGAERQMAYLSSFLSEKGYDVTLVTLKTVDDKYKVSPSVKRIVIGYDVSKSKLYKLFKKIYLFFYFLTLRTDCVISFQLSANIESLRALRFRRDIRVIVSERNTVAWNLSKTESFAYGDLYLHADYVVPNSHTMSQYLNKYNPKLSPKIKTIINYTDTTLYKVTPLPLGDTLQIGIFARFQKQKNYERFAEMLYKVKQVSHRPFIVRWYGDIIKDSFYEHFNELINKYKINDIIELHNFATDVPQVMESIDMICLPSTYEGFSNSISEAICCGKPVIAGDVSDNSVMVKEGVNGYLFNPYDVEDMSRVFIYALNSSNEELKKMSVNSRLIAEQLFSKEAFVNSYIHLIN